MLDQIKTVFVRARAYVWAMLLALYPFADQIIAAIEAQLPVIAPYLGQSTFRYMGLAIVVAKLVLQLYRGWRNLGALLGRQSGAGNG